jgi:hypothetical protein
MIIFSKIERVGGKVILTYFRVLMWHLAGGIEENHEKPQSRYWCPGIDSNWILNIS